MPGDAGGGDLIRVHYGLRLVKQAILDPTGFEFSTIICELRYDIFANSEYCGFKAKQTILLAGKSALIAPNGRQISSHMT